MAKIKTYTSDTSLAGTEKFIGSDTDGTTLNYTISDLGTYMAGSGLTSSNGILAVDDSEAVAATIAAGDFITFLDGGTSGTYAKGSINDVATLFAGTAASTGLSASSGVLTVSDLHPVGVTGSNNQLLTDDGDGTVTSESNLSFDGSVLAVSGTQTITSTTADQLKVLYDSSNYALMNVSASGDLEVETIGAGSTDSDITLNADGDIELNADGGQVTIKDDTANHFLLDCDNTAFTIYDDQDEGDLFKIQVAQHGATTISTTDDDSNDDADLTLDADGKIVIEAKASDEAVFNEGGLDVDFRVEAVDETHMIFVEGSSNRVSIGDSVDSPAATLEVTNHATAGAYNVPLMQLNSNDTNQTALDINAANIDGGVLDITANALTTGNLINIAAGALTTGYLIRSQTAHVPADTAHSTLVSLDVDFDAVGSSDFKAIYMNIDKDGITASGKTSNVYGMHVDLDDSVTNVGAVNTYGVAVNNNFANTGGDVVAYGLYTNVGGGDTNYDIYMENSADSTEYAYMRVGAGGALTIATESDDITGHMALTADGKVTITPGDITGDVFHLDADADTDNITNIDVGVLDIDATATATITTAGLTKFEALGVEIENTGAAAALLIDNDTVGQVALDIDAANTTANIIDISATAATTGHGIFIDHHWNSTATADTSGIYIDADSSAAPASGQTVVYNAGRFEAISSASSMDGSLVARGARFDAQTTTSDSGATAVGGRFNGLGYTAYGLEVLANANASSTVAYGALIKVGTAVAAGTNYGVVIQTPDAGTSYDLMIKSNDDPETDRFYIQTGTAGATTIATNDDGGHAADLTFTVDGFTKFAAADTTGGGVEIENGTAAGTAALLIDSNDTDQIALDIDADNIDANVLDIAATALTTAKAINVDVNAITTGYAAYFDIADTATGNVNKSNGYVAINYAKSGVTGSGSTNQATGLQINMTDAATNNASGAVTMKGLDILVDSASDTGTISNVGIDIEAVTDGDAASSYGLRTKVEDGGYDLMILSSANTSDYFTIQVGAEGATTLATVDVDSAAGHLTLQPDGDLLLNASTSADLNIKHNKDGKDLIFQQYDGTEVARVHDGANLPSAAGTSTSIASGNTGQGGFGYRKMVYLLGSGNDDNVLTLTAAQSGGIVFVTPTNNVGIKLPVGIPGIHFKIVLADKINKVFSIFTNGAAGDNADNFYMHCVSTDDTTADVDGDTITFTNALEGSTIDLTCLQGGGSELWLAEIKSLDAVDALVAD